MWGAAMESCSNFVRVAADHMALAREAFPRKLCSTPGVCTVRQKFELKPAQNFQSSEVDAGATLEVRWMATGEVACSVSSAHTGSISIVEGTVREKIGVPEREQRLFQDGAELPIDASLSTISASPLMLVRTLSDPRVTDLSHYHIPTNFEELRASDFTLGKRVSQGINGDIFRYQWHREDVPLDALEGASVTVAVKKLRNACLSRPTTMVTDERAAHLEPWKNAPPLEDSLAEIGVLSYLSKQPDLPKYLIQMLGCFSGPANQTWLVTEFAEGGELFNVAGSLQEDKARRYSLELLRGMDYLHRHRIAHRDISLENILIQDDSVKLMDFGVAVCSHSGSGTELRYFRVVGKNFYRPPECHVPPATETRVTAPPCSHPEDVVMLTTDSGYLCEVRLPLNSAPGESCKAAVWGYAAIPVDIFEAGMCIFILYCGFPVWQKALPFDPSFAYVHRLGKEGLASILQLWQKPLPSACALDLITDMLRTDAPSKRPSASECLESPWFASHTKESKLV